MESEMLNWLKDYLKNTPTDQIKKEWKSIEDLGFKGPIAFEYLDFLHQTYGIFS